MPIYEYRCDSCAHELEVLRKISDPPLTQCPECEQDSRVKKVSAAAFRLKGGGWYETDFKKSGQKNLAGDAAKPESKAKAETAKPATDKPASKSSSASSSAA